MINWNNIQQTIGTVQEYNYYGQTYRGVIKSVREISTNRGVFSVITDKHEVCCDWTGHGVKYNDFSSAFVRCEDDEITRAALKTIENLFPQDVLNSIRATFRINQPEWEIA